MDWPEITKDTPLEEIKRIHQQIWQYVVENGNKPDAPYICCCVACEYVRVVFGKPAFEKCCKCPIAWSSRKSSIEPCGVEYYEWFICATKENAEKIRDIPFKYELEKKGAGE